MFQQTIPGYTETVKVWDINSSKGKQFHRETIKPWIKAKALLAKYYLTVVNVWGKRFKLPQLSHESFLTIDPSCKIFF